VTAGAAPWAADRRVLTAGLLGLVTAGAFEGMAAPTVLPVMVRELGGLDLYGWAFSAFWLTNILGITLAGSDADRHGPARGLLAGAVLFALGMVVSGLATTMPLVILGRAVQGLGAGALGAVTYTTIARGYAPSARPRMIAFTSSAWVVPGLVGPALASLLAETVGWRWVFLGIAPPVLIMAVLVLPQLRSFGPVNRAASHARGDGRRAIDAVELALGSTALIAATTIGSLPLGILLAVGGLALTVRPLRHLLPAGSLRFATGRPAVFGTCFAVAFAFFGTEAFVPLTLAEVRGASTWVGGLTLSAAAVSWATGSWLQARAAAAGIRRSLVLAGFGLIVVGIAVIAAVLLPSAPIAVAVAGWGIAGLGMGLAFSMLSLLVLESAPAGEEGRDSAALQLMFTLGTAFGAGFGGAVVALAEAGVLGLAPALGLVDGLMLLAAVAGGMAALRVPQRRSPTAGARPAHEVSLEVR
jgi:MFS family permease